MFAQLLMISSALIILTLGLMHVSITFWGDKLSPREPGLREQLRDSHLVLTKGTTFWKAWIGFNASHSLGAILFSLIYGYLALQQAELLFHSTFLLSIGLLFLIGYFILGKVYWFKIPFSGISLALVCYVTSLLV
jgi:hypothetical protein